MRENWIYIGAFVCLVFASCSNYNRIVKGDNYAEKFDFANSLYDEGEYLRSIVLYEQIYQHSPKSGEG